MPRVTVAYFIHRVQYPNRRLNLDRSYRWIKWLVDTLPDNAILAPWLPYCEALDEDTYRDRGIRDGKAMASLDGIRLGIVGGPQVSSGCAADIANLMEMGASILDLTPLGFEEPPPPTWDDLRSVVRITASRLGAIGESTRAQVTLTTGRCFSVTNHANE